MKIEIHNPNNLPTIDYREVKEFQGNLKDLTKDNYAKLKKSIEENGFFIPMFLWKCNGKFKVLDVHQRLRVLKKEQATPCEIPYIEIEAKNEQEAKKKLLLISSQYGTITREGLDEFAFDLDTDWMADTLNFDNVFDFDKITDVEEDEFEIPNKIETDIKLGNLFQLGDHRLLCGDATKKEDIEKLMDGQKADMIYCDPPYGMKLGADFTGMKSKSSIKISAIRKKYPKVIGDNEDFNPQFIINIFEYFDYCKEIFLWGADYYSQLLPNRNDGSWIVWDKRKGMENVYWTLSEFELCFSKVKHLRRIARFVWFGLNGLNGLQYEEGENQSGSSKRLHPTQKPTLLHKWFFENWGKKDDIVVDLFGGSGSTLIACEQLNRRCYMSEIDPSYCQIIIDRWEKFTGNKSKKIN